MLSPALRRNTGNGAFQHFQQSLLHAFARNIACNGSVLALASDFINLIDIDDAALRAFHIVIRRLQELHDDVFHILPDITGFRQSGRVSNGKGNIQHFGHCLCEQRLPGTGRADEQDVAFLKLYGVLLQPAAQDAFIVVVDGNRENLFCSLLANHVLIKICLDLHGLRESVKDQGQPVVARNRTLFKPRADDTHAHAHAIVTDITAVSGNQPVHLRLRFPAK